MFRYFLRWPIGWTIVLALVIGTAEARDRYNSKCYYEAGRVYEDAASRPLSSEELAQMTAYGKAWMDYGINVAGYYLDLGKLPLQPTLPCFCKDCTVD